MGKMMKIGKISEKREKNLITENALHLELFCI